MDLIEGIKTRRSIRKYTDQKIERDTIRSIIEATAYAPSWKNTQIARYIVVEDRDLINLIANEGAADFPGNVKNIMRSTVVAVQTVVTGISGYEPDGSFSTDKGNGWEMYDAGISAQTFCLAAHEYGIGTVIMGIFDENKVKELLNIPKEQSVTAIIGMGYPEGARMAPPRKSVDELLTFIPENKN